MASTKPNDTPKSGPSSDALKSHGLSLSHSKLESYSGGISDENDRNSNLSPSKSTTDPARKKTFKITSVKKGGSGSGDIGVDNDADSIDGLDESQTEDLSSEFYDSSKATDLDMDLQDCMNIPLTPDEMTSTTTIVVKQKPDQNSQSRFRVVKIETKEPFRRGKWVCYDFFDTAPAALVTVEKNGSKMTEDSIIQSALSGNLSSSSSVHYVPDVNDSSSNIFIPPVVPMSPSRADGHQFLSDVFVPIQPAPASQVLSQLDGLTSDAMAPFIAQQVLMSVASVPSSSSSFHNLAQPGHTTIIQSLPHASLFPYPQNSSPASMFQNGVTGQTSQMINLPSDALIAINSTLAQTALGQLVQTTGEDNISQGQGPNINQGQGPVIMSGVPVPHSQSQTQIAGDVFVPQGIARLPTETGPSSGLPASVSHVPQSRTETSLTTSCTDIGDQMGPGMDESTGSVKTLQGDPDGQSSEGLKEAVEAVGDMYMGLEGNEDDADERISEVAALLSGLPEIPTITPLRMSFRHLDSPARPVGSICPSPLPPTIPNYYDTMAGIIPAHATTHFIPLPAQDFRDSNHGHPVTPIPVSYQNDHPFFHVPSPLVFSPASPFVPFDLSRSSPFMPYSLAVLPPSRPRSMTFVSVPSSASRGMSMTPVPRVTDSYSMSVTPVPHVTDSYSMSVTPVPHVTDSYSMSMTPASSAFLPANLTLPSVLSPSRPRSMTFASVPRSASRGLSVTPAPHVTDSYNMIMTPALSALTPSNSPATSVLSPSRPRSMTVIPIPHSSVSSCMSMTPTSSAFDSYSMSMTHSPSAFTPVNHHLDSYSMSSMQIPPAVDSHIMSMSRTPSAIVPCSMALTSALAASVSQSMSGHHLNPSHKPSRVRIPVADPACPQPNPTIVMSPPQPALPPLFPTSRTEEPSSSYHSASFVESRGYPAASRSSTQSRCCDGSPVRPCTGGRPCVSI